MMAVTPASSNRSARSSARTVLCLVQPSTATRPSRASMPTAIWPGHCRQAALTRPGSLTATVPRMTRLTPASIHWAMLSMVRMPPPSWAGTATALRMLCTAARLTGWPSTAPLRSTRCSHSQPALANALAWAAGLSLNTVARAMSPRSRRTHLPSLRSMAGKRSIAAGGLARPVGGRHPHGYSPGRTEGQLMTRFTPDLLTAEQADLTAIRRDIHRHPETAFEEQRTSQIVADRLTAWGIDIHRGLGKTGVVGTLKGKRPGQKTIGLRADMDALHLQEKNDFDYASSIPNKMHACGHDGHTTMLLGAAQHLAAE